MSYFLTLSADFLSGMSIPLFRLRREENDVGKNNKEHESAHVLCILVSYDRFYLYLKS